MAQTLFRISEPIVQGRFFAFTLLSWLAMVPLQLHAQCNPDTTAPVLLCPDKYIWCNQDTDPSTAGLPTASDNCTPVYALNMSWSDASVVFSCGTYQNGVPVSERIDRTWTIADGSGNASTCVQTIWMKHIGISNLIYPPNHDGIIAPALSCGQDPTDLDLTGQPTVAEMPIDNFGPCEFGVTFSDQTIGYCLPAGYSVLRTWTAVDFCTGSVSNHLQIIKVQDVVPPSIVPPANLTVGTDGFLCSGTVLLPHAVTSDNCSAVTTVPNWSYGSGYGPFSGVSAGVHVVNYVATDACGNMASATMTVTVVDNTPPQAICQASLQLSLSTNGQALLFASTADAGSNDNCGPVTLTVSRDSVHFYPSIQLSCLDQGPPLTITLKATDAGGLENFCTTAVSVRDFLKPTVVCPSNITLTCTQDYHNLQVTGQATAADNCSLQGLTFFDIANVSACNTGSVTRVWTATDLAGNSKSCIQQIALNAVSNVTVVFPPDVTVSACASPGDLLPAHTGTPSTSGQYCSPLSVIYTDQVFPFGTPVCFRILRTWSVYDWCVYNPNGGTAGYWVKTQIIDVKDQSPPVLTIPPDVTVSAVSPATTAAVSLPDAAATDCSTVTLTNNSLYATAAGINASGNYPPGVTAVEFTATDACGNSVRQTMHITVLHPAQVHFIQGHIRTELGAPVRAIPVELVADGYLEWRDCDTTGFFRFDSVPAGNQYLLSPSNNANWMNGLSTYDLVLISKHILGIQPLGSPYRMIAADANRSGSVTTADIVQLRKLILGIQDTVTGNTSWRFLPVGYAFPNTQNPFAAPFPEGITFPNLDSNYIARDFTGVKIGDVNNSTDPAQARSAGDTLPVVLPDLLLLPGHDIDVPVELPDVQSLDGFQFELSVDPEFISTGRLEVSTTGLLQGEHVFRRSPGVVAVSWNKGGEGTYGSTQLFTLHLSALKAVSVSDAVSISTGRLSPEGYRTGTGDLVALQLQTRQTSLAGNRLFSCQPNPFHDRTAIPFYVSQEGVVTCAVYDVSGRVVEVKRKTCSAGDNALYIYAEELPPGDGFYFFTLEMPDGTEFRGKFLRTR